MWMVMVRGRKDGEAGPLTTTRHSYQLPSGAGIRSLCTHKAAEVGQRDIIAAAKRYVLASCLCHSVVNTPCPTLQHTSHTCLVQQQVHCVFKHQLLEVAVYQLLLPATDTLCEPVSEGGAGDQHVPVDVVIPCQTAYALVAFGL